MLCQNMELHAAIREVVQLACLVWEEWEIKVIPQPAHT